VRLINCEVFAGIHLFEIVRRIELLGYNHFDAKKEFVWC